MDNILFAARGNDILMLELKDDSNPCQYAVAQGIYRHKGELSRLNDDFFPLTMYPDTAVALKDTAINLTRR